MLATAAITALMVASALLSCTGEKTPKLDETQFEIEERYERGPITVELGIDRGEITIAERITLVLRATVEEEYEVELPKFGEKLEQFGIVDYENPPSRLTDAGRVLTQKSYVLEPFLSGDYHIPPMTVRFWKRDEAEPKQHEIETEEQTIKVESLLPENITELKIRDIAGPVEFPKPKRGWLYALVLGGLALVAALVGVVLWMKRRKRAAAFVPQIPSHELAYHALEKLLAEKLLEKGQVKLFYTRVSDILRHYIENRFGLHAPERTTEEFLKELRGHDVLRPEHKVLLREYLGHCDLVKFAELQPTNTESQKTFDACKQFIVETESEEAKVPMASGV